MKAGKIVVGVIAGGMLGATAAVMAVPGYRSMVAKRARSSGKKMLRMAKQFFPL